MELIRGRERSLEGTKVLVLEEALGTMPPDWQAESYEIGRDGETVRYKFAQAWITPKNVVVPGGGRK